MASFVVKSMVGGPLKSLAGGLTGGGEGGGDKGGGDAGGGGGGMTRDEYEEYRKQLLEEKMERDAHFTQKKAERATVRTHFREKYHLPKSEQDAAKVQLAGGAVELPPDLAKMVRSEQQQQQEQQQLQVEEASLLNSLPILGVESLREKAQETLHGVRQAAEQKCSVM
ncbi:complexin-3-like [Lethenteron reissneri]|uniref:complexin-3-like n=1 Tax=Lethenteron reissneri TaxID=7753 RepID=UPI002AB76409|nr:complexin-3-like [Lethenteron reissneri]